MPPGPWTDESSRDLSSTATFRTPVTPRALDAGRPESVPFAEVWVVAGAPGAGKSTVADRLLRLARPVPALLDKDTIYGEFVAATLSVAGRPDGEREGPWYDEHIKAHEYAGMTAVAREIRERGCPVLLSAPFTDRIRDPGRWRRWVAELGGEPVRLVWVGCEEAVLRRRLERRGLDRDAGKLAAFEAFTARMRPTEPPELAHLAVDTSDEDVARIDDRLREVLGDDGRPHRSSGL